MSCPACYGTGTDPESTQARFRTVREELSRWERWTGWLRFGPEDQRPKIRFDGSVPLVERFLELYRSPDRDLRVVKWGSHQSASNTWTVTALIRVREAGMNRDEWRRFLIRQREIVGVEVLPATSHLAATGARAPESRSIANDPPPTFTREVP